MERGLRCTRSQAAPDWTVQECLILVNEINAIEGEWKHSLASFQKWQLVVENCNALDVYRSLNQCKRKWESLLSHYNQVKPYECAYWGFDVSERTELGLPENFSAEIFQAIDKYVTERRDDEDGRGGVGPQSDPDSDPEAQFQDDDADGDGYGSRGVVSVAGPKRQYKRALPQKRKVQERLNPWRHAIGKKVKQEPHSLNERVKPPKSHAVVEVKPEPSSAEYNLNGRVEPPRTRISGNLKLEPGSAGVEQTMALNGRVEPPRTWRTGNLRLETGSVGGVEQTMAENLLENARMINTVLEGNLGEDVDCKPADLKNYEATQNDFTRLQGDKLIHYLGKFAATLGQLCDHLQQCN